MSDLLTPAELAAIERRSVSARKLPEYLRKQDHMDREALLRHIAALEARTPVPATDIDALLAEAEDEAPVAGSFRDLIQRLATALRESRAREQAEPYRHALEQRLICSNLPLLTGDADADLMRFVFHEQELALSPEAGVIAELKEQRDTALSWTATYTNMDVYRRCLAAAIARAEKAEAERKEDHDILREAFNAYAPFEAKGSTDNPIGRAIVVMKFLNDDLAAARVELGALGPVEWEKGKDTGGGLIIWEALDPYSEPAFTRAIRVVKEAQ